MRDWRIGQTVHLRRPSACYCMHHRCDFLDLARQQIPECSRKDMFQRVCWKGTVEALARTFHKPIIRLIGEPSTRRKATRASMNGPSLEELAALL
jgi:hypothetical protein